MTFNAQEFRASFQSNPANPAYFQAFIHPPQRPQFPLPQEMSANVAQQLTLRCQASQLPGRILTQTESKVNGPPRQVAVGQSETAITCQFIVTEGGPEHAFFVAWQQWAVNSTGQFRPRYYDDYVGELKLHHFNTLGEHNFSMTLLEAYPSSVGTIEVDWRETNTYILMQVDFTYRTWRYDPGKGFFDDTQLGVPLFNFNEVIS